MTGSGWRATAVALVALVLAPVLVLVQPSVVEAATAVGDPKGWSTTVDVGGDIDDKCSGTARWIMTDAGGAYIDYNGKCWVRDIVGRGFDAGSSVGLEFTGTDLASGTSCGLSGSNSLEGPASGVTFAGQTTSSTAADECSITKLCVTLRHVQDGWWDQRGTTCVTYELGVPPVDDPSDNCKYGQPMGATWNFEETPTGPDNVTFTVDVRAASNAPIGGRQWNALFWWSGVGSEGVLVANGGNAITLQPGQLGTMTRTLSIPDSWNTIQFPGVEVVAVDTALHARNDNVGVYGNRPGPAAYPPKDYYGAITDEPLCRFWVGSKILDIPGEFDDPFMGVNEPPPGPEPLPDPDAIDDSTGCSFSILDPSTYMCGLLELVRQLISAVLSLLGWLADILAAIVGLVADLIAKLGGLLEDLFIPSPSSWGWEGFIDQVKTRPPTSIAVDLVDAGQGVASGFQSGGTCGVIADFGDDMSISCGQINSISGFSALYGIVQAALVGLTAFSIFHILRGVLSGGAD